MMRAIERFFGSWWAFATCAALGFLYAPIMSRFALSAPTCMWTMGLDDWPRIFANAEHIAASALLFGLALPRLERAPVIRAATIVLAYGIALELSQMFFTRGHCRLWDVVANVLGITVAVAIQSAWSRRR